MKSLLFKNIQELLDDPFFEARLFGKDAIKQRISTMEKYGEVPSNFQFIDWTVEDNKDVIEYSFAATDIGNLLIANTSKGICFLGFATNGEDNVRADFMRRFPNQQIKEQISDFQKTVIDFCNGNNETIRPLHMKGTDFQLQIWKKLTCIPIGKLSTYGALVNSKASQAVGSAVGANPISYIVPCHRIVKSDGDYRGYHWGSELKKQLLAYEFHSK